MPRRLLKQKICDLGLRWPHSPGQVGGEDKLFPGFYYAASFRLDAIAEWGRLVL